MCAALICVHVCVFRAVLLLSFVAYSRIARPVFQASLARFTSTILVMFQRQTPSLQCAWPPVA